MQTSPSEENALYTKGYKLIKHVDEGTYAKVYLSEFRTKDCSGKSLLACKIINTEKAAKEFVKKFLPREIETLIRINHPYIIHVHYIFQRNAKYYIFMRFAENGDLLDYLLKKGGLAENHARVWLRQLALALQYLHEMNIAHRDVKCENILVTANYNVKLTDFGFARLCVDSNNKSVLSATYCGSLSYVAPEVLCARPYAPMTADVWSLGVVVFVMLNKATPFDGHQVKKILDQLMRRKWKFRPRVAENLSLECEALVRSMIEPDCLVRYKIDQVITSSWIAMDERLTLLNPNENAALEQAKRDKFRKTGAKKPDDSAGQSLQAELEPLPLILTELKFVMCYSSDDNAFLCFQGYGIFNLKGERHAYGGF